MYEIFESLMKEKGVRAANISKATGIPGSTFSDWKSGRSKPKQEKLQKIADYFGVTVEYLMTGKNPVSDLPVGAIPVDVSSFVNVPILGCVRCGEPMFADSNIEGYQPTPSADILTGYEYFYLRAKGDSMINARIYDGDIVFIRQQPSVENGEIAAVLIDDTADIAETTLKRVYIYDSKVMLVAENPKYPPMSFEKEEMNSVRILGKAVAFLSGVR